MGEQAAPAERRAAELFAAEVRRRTTLDVSIGGTAPTKYTLVAGTQKSSAEVTEYAQQYPEAAALKTDGFYLATTPDEKGHLYVVGQSPSGVVAGIGKLLRLSCYADGAMEIPQLTLSDYPRMPIRGMYFATHFENFYHVAPLEEVDRIIEGLALWGANSLSVWFDMHHFNGFEDPAAQKHLGRLKHMAGTAHGLGMQFGLTFIANEGYASSPKHLREQGAPGAYGVELCPSKPEGLALIGKWQAQVIEAFPQVDFVWMWPYDQGGCCCDQCKPWGANGFLRASEQLANLYRERFPQGKAWLSIWGFVYYINYADEYKDLFRYMREKKPAWFDGIIASTHTDVIAKELKDRPSPERYPLTSFPEISMFGMGPWGGFGANPLPRFCGGMVERADGQLQGGWPYSEGIYEDLNKFFWVQYYWNQERTTDDILAEYAAYYLCPEVADDAVRLFYLMEETHHRGNWQIPHLQKADEVWALAESINNRLPSCAKTAWRWRILHIRAAMDHISKKMPGSYATPEIRAALKPLLAELTRIYHGNWVVSLPPLLDPRHLSYLRPVTVSSSFAGYEKSAHTLVDGVLAEENFWVHDPAKEKTAWACIDLGKPADIQEVRLGFRNLGGKYAFVPGSLGFEVSHDGKNFTPAGSSAKVPKEDDAVAAGAPAWIYEIGKPGRYLRVNLGASQRKQQPFAGTLELTEIQVFGKRDGEPVRGAEEQ